MIVVSISENKKIEKRIAITPEIAKKYISIGFEVLLPENYGSHLGIKDTFYSELGVKILKDEKEILKKANIIVQLSFLSEEMTSILQKDQILIGVLNKKNNNDRSILLSFSHY